ncbi:hypothetical protein BWQ96_06393 [Gracilariopsis chorda]|uniref:Uncharacterized protein n=1 Tax=Gracilariopsis chorda TaxID=448386 RepID=A0A2V3IP66_9FLOR|nr:hypothetical protein BWQ96_06393 [Gracilariopsis chorda]|eukprot:PXF43847.1 hypothetical protein BWQ96_06393 [Gracilariopsis chorda]
MDTPLVPESYRRPTARHNVVLFASAVGSRLSRAGLFLVVAVVSLVLFAVKRVGVHHPFIYGESNGLHSIPSPTNRFGLLDKWTTDRPTRWLGMKSSRISSNFAASSRAGLSTWFGSHSRQDSIATGPDDSCGIGDVMLDERIGTRDCAVGRICRARLVLNKEEGEVTIRAGYNIFPKRKDIGVDRTTKRRVKATTRKEATKWATVLLSKIQEDMKELGCDVNVSMIADAIMKSKDDVVRCPRTDSPLCTPLETIKTCTVLDERFETEEQRACQEFMKTGTTDISLDYLSTGSPCAGNFQQWDSPCLSVSVPFCTTTCQNSSCPKQERVMFAPLSVCASNYGNGDGIASIFTPVYSTIIGSWPLPPCEVFLGREELDHSGILPVATSSADKPAPIQISSLPGKLLSLIEGYGLQLRFVFFYIYPTPFVEYLQRSCLGGTPGPVLPTPTPEPVVDKCQQAYDLCGFYFGNETDVPVFSVDGPDNVAFSPVIESRNDNENLGVLNSNNLEVEIFEGDGNYVGITSLPASQTFSRTQFKPFSLSNTKGSGIGHETFQADQREVIRGRCVRVFFSHFQLLELTPPFNVVGNVVAGREDNKCVVFKTV